MTETAGDSRADPKVWAIIIWVCFLVSFLKAVHGAFWFVSLLGVIFAYAKRQDLRHTCVDGHTTSAIWTFWTNLIVSTVAALFVIEGFRGAAMVAIPLGAWVIFRVLRGLIFAIDGREIADPHSLL